MDSDSFGTTIDIDGDFLVVGAHQTIFPAIKIPEVPTFLNARQNGQYSEIAKLLPEKQGGARFGDSVALNMVS